MGRDDRPAYASNWWVVVLADVGLAVVPIVVGILWGGLLGAVVFFAALAYLALVVRRAFRWRRLRRDAGL